MTCPLCQTRRPRRFCPPQGGDICAPCCGEARENTIACPLDCEYLQEARRHDRPVALDYSKIPNLDIQVTDDFLSGHQGLISFLAVRLAGTALRIEGVVDLDARAGLESLVRTYRTLNSGIYYDTRPENPLAAALHDAVQAAVEEYRREEQKRLGLTKTRDADVLGAMAFLQRMELEWNNGRPRSRAFLQLMWDMHAKAAPAAPAQPSSLILP